MHAKTAAAVAGSLLALPSLAAATDASDPATPAREALRAPFGGHLTVRAQMLAAHRQDVTETRRQAARRRHARRHRREARSTASPALQAIAACESGGDPATNTGNGFYGKYQFSLATWHAVGGTGTPAAASEAEQDRRAAQLYAQAGPGQWPVCGR